MFNYSSLFMHFHFFSLLSCFYLWMNWKRQMSMKYSSKKSSLWNILFFSGFLLNILLMLKKIRFIRATYAFTHVYLELFKWSHFVTTELSQLVCVFVHNDELLSIFFSRSILCCCNTNMNIWLFIFIWNFSNFSIIYKKSLSLFYYILTMNSKTNSHLHKSCDE